MSSEVAVTPEVRERVASFGLDVDNVLSWTGRSKRQRQQPRTYWNEYVETDHWYMKEIVADVPKSEMHAACVDEQWSADEKSEESEAEFQEEDEETDDGEEEDEEEPSPEK